MSDSEIDDLIDELNSSLEEPLEKLLAIGEPALVRLMQTVGGQVPPRNLTMPKYPIDAIENQNQALAVLSSKWPDTTIELIRDGKVKMTLATIMGLRGCSDSRVRQIVKDALKAGDF